MNADKVYAETIAKEYVPKLYYKTVALKKPKSGLLSLPARLELLWCLCLKSETTSLYKQSGGNHPPVLIAGIALKFVGLAGVSANYPLYKKLLERDKQKYAYDIVQLADQIIEATAG